MRYGHGCEVDYRSSFYAWVSQVLGETAMGLVQLITGTISTTYTAAVSFADKNVKGSFGRSRPMQALRSGTI
ncbi:hypothetical protein CG471_15650 [Sphingobium sp. IP1]|nr:hypothetical protein CG471_15650 [Sphingobium sp. IP1]